VSIYEKRHLRKHRRLLPLQAGEFRAAEAMTPEQEKALPGELATPKIMLRRLRADVKRMVEPKPIPRENDDHDDASVLAEVHHADHKLKSLTGAGKRKPSAPVCRCGAPF
jgi:hypothetical protein